MENKKELIENFLSLKIIAVAGASRNPKKFGHQVVKLFKDGGYTVYPVNPSGEQIAGTASFADVSALPQDTEGLVIVTKPGVTDQVLDAAIARGIKNIWIQQMSETKAVLEKAAENQLKLVSKECVFMFVEPVKSIHKFHRFIKKLFRKYPC